MIPTIKCHASNLPVNGALWFQKFSKYRHSRAFRIPSKFLYAKRESYADCPVTGASWFQKFSKFTLCCAFRVPSKFL